MTYVMCNFMLHRLVTSVGGDRRNHRAASPGWPQVREGRETSEGQPPSKRGNSRRWKRQPDNPRNVQGFQSLGDATADKQPRSKTRRTTQNSMRFPGREESVDRLSYCKKTVHYFTIPISSLSMDRRSPSYLALTSGSLGGGSMGVSFRRLLVVISVLCLASLTAFGQFLSGVDGSVRDRTGALVAGAKVKITDNRTQVSKGTTTNESGYFRIDSIAASTYTIRIEMSHFRTWELSGLEVPVGQIRTVAPTLDVASQEEKVTVTSEAAEVAVNLAKADTGSVIQASTVQETPLVGQNVYSLTTLTPGLTGSAVTARDADNFTNEYAININAAGLRQEQNGYADR